MIILRHSRYPDCAEAHHYTESGHNDVWLINGFNIRVRDGETYVGVSDVFDAHDAIEAIRDGRSKVHGPWHATKINLPTETA